MLENGYKKDIYEIIMNNITNKKAEIISMYTFFEKNKGKKYSDFINALYEEYGRKFDINMLKALTSKIRKYHSISKGEEMQYIILLSIGLEKNDKDTIDKCNKKLDEIEKNKNHVENKSYTYMGIRAKEMHSDKLEEKIAKAKKIMQKVIDGEKLEDDEIVDAPFYQFVKKNFKKFDEEFYMNFLIKSNNIKEITQEEIDQLYEVVNFFLDNLYYTKISPIKQYLYNINVRGVEARINLYSKYRNMLIELKENNNFSGVKYVESIAKKVLYSEYEFINDFYQNMVTINKVKSTYIDGLLVQQKHLDEIKEKFTKKLIK